MRIVKDKVINRLYIVRNGNQHFTFFNIRKAKEFILNSSIPIADATIEARFVINYKFKE